MQLLLINKNGEEVKLDEPTGWELPPKGFEVKDDGYLAPEEDGSHVEVAVKEDSERLQLLEPFTPLGDSIRLWRQKKLQRSAPCR